MGCAAACLSNITVQRLAVEAAVHADIMLLRQAMMMDPLVGAVCNPPEIWQMVDEMLIAEAEWLPQYADEIERAKQRWAKAEADGTLIPPIITQGAARLHTKTVEEMAANKEAARRNAAEADKAKERPAAKEVIPRLPEQQSAHGAVAPCALFKSQLAAPCHAGVPCDVLRASTPMASDCAVRARRLRQSASAGRISPTRRTHEL